MKDVIYLAVSRRGVMRMTKNLPSLMRGEIPVKLELTVDEKAFREPVIVKQVEVNDWREGIDIADVDFKETFITAKEAAMIKEQRLARMQEILEQQGFTVTPPEEGQRGQ